MSEPEMPPIFYCSADTRDEADRFVSMLICEGYLPVGALLFPREAAHPTVGDPGRG